MSELINNREHRQKLMKQVIKELHEGKSVAEVKEKFQEVIEGVSAKEIAMMEVELVKEGLPIEEIQNLCDVHAEVFKGSIEEIHRPEELPGHPIYTMKRENEEIEKHIDETMQRNLKKFTEIDSEENILALMGDVNLLWDIDKHYSRKENLIFPYLEKYGVTAPPKVMWGVDDEIRAKLKQIKLDLTSYKGEKEEIISKIEDVINQIKEMIFKEDSILFPMSLDTLAEDEWISIYNDSDEIGYAIIPGNEKWKRFDIKSGSEKVEQGTSDGRIRFKTGVIGVNELNCMLNNIPGDMTFVDKDNIVRYFSQGKDRIFARTRAIIGRTVENCHPPASVKVVDQLIRDFKEGKKDSEDFWIRMEERYILIRYFAVRDENGEFLGTLEFTQDIAPIQEITGEKRLISE